VEPTEQPSPERPPTPSSDDDPDRGPARADGTDRAPLVVYRGVLQRSRLRLLLSSLAAGWSEADFLWISTKRIDDEQVRRLEAVLDGLPVRYRWRVLDGSRGAWPASRAAVRRHLAELGEPAAVAIGQSALAYLPRRRQPLVLCMNGIPEERALQRPGARSAAAARGSWATYRALLQGRGPTLGVVVSERMGRLVRERLGVPRFVVAPTAVGPEYFQVRLDPSADRPHDLCYQGSGAAWQNLDHLSAVWRRVADLRPATRFLVLSYDPRCRALATGLPPDRVTLTEAFEPSDVARGLAEARVGFVLRSDHLVNRVAYPTKIGESLACGVPLVVSDLDWDPSDLLRRHSSAGRLVAPGAATEVAADAAIDLLDHLTPDTAARCRHAAQDLDRHALAERVGRAIHDHVLRVSGA
jgi:glycosyltransferase involved in cell wall biosynthesis